LITLKTALRSTCTFCAAFLIAGLACASGGAGGGGGNGGGGGGGVVPQPAPMLPIGGTYTGTVASGAPVIQLSANMSLTEDSAGNLSGTLCIQECTALAGKASTSPFFPFGIFQFRAGDNQISGIVEGPVTCGDGSAGMWIAGSFANRGATSSFSLTTCP
jgi:hypothetical protein